MMLSHIDKDNDFSLKFIKLSVNSLELYKFA